MPCHSENKENKKDWPACLTIQSSRSKEVNEKSGIIKKQNEKTFWF
jgi:hypothetical protein